MTDAQLNAFLKVGQSGSFSKAAEELFISKQALIKQINNLEEEIDCKLLSRTREGIAFTKAGEVFARDVGQVLRELQAAVKKCHDIAAEVDALRVSMPYRPMGLLEKAMAEYSRRYPNINQEVVFRNRERKNPFSDLLNDVIDAVESSLCTYQPMEGIDYLPLPPTTYHCLVSASHRLADRQTITLEDLIGERVGIPNAAKCPEFLDAVTLAKLDLNLVERHAGAGHDMQFIYNYCLSGGVYVSRAQFTRYLPSLVTIEIEPAITAEYGLFYKSPPVDAVRDFLDIVSESIQNIDAKRDAELRYAESFM